MRTHLLSTIGLLLLAAVTNLSFGQYINKLHDHDSTSDWGLDIFRKIDGNYFIIGTAQPVGRPSSVMNMTVSGDGNAVVDTHKIWDDSAAIGCGDYGQAKKTSTGYIAPLIIQHPNAATGYLYSTGGFIKYNEAGDTVFTRTYTDTSNYFERILSCDVMPDGGYIGGGTRALNTPSYFPGLIVRTDSMGDTLWTHVYQKYSMQSVVINSVLAQPDARIVVGARSNYDAVTPSLEVYYHRTPWFLVLDGNGSILLDTMYGVKYMGEGRIYKDTTGGYIHVGQIDTLVTSDPNEYENFPNYIAHLDTNFRMTWITRFPFLAGDGHRYSMGAKQLRDGNYITYGVSWRYPYSQAWAAKVKRIDGSIVWNRFYARSVAHAAYITDVVENEDGALVFVGSTLGDSSPAWHQDKDVWLLGTDSNGCPVVNCDAPIRVPKVEGGTMLTLFPDPTAGLFTIHTMQSGVLTCFNVQGQRISEYKLIQGDNECKVPVNANGGVYICRFSGNDGTTAVIQLMYNP